MEGELFTAADAGRKYSRFYGSAGEQGDLITFLTVYLTNGATVKANMEGSAGTTNYIRSGAIESSFSGRLLRELP